VNDWIERLWTQPMSDATMTARVAAMLACADCTLLSVNGRATGMIDRERRLDIVIEPCVAHWIEVGADDPAMTR
jgi:hypothetical protein